MYYWRFCCTIFFFTVFRCLLKVVFWFFFRLLGVISFLYAFFCTVVFGICVLCVFYISECPFVTNIDILSMNFVLPATWFEKHGFFGKHWLYRRFFGSILQKMVKPMLSMNFVLAATWFENPGFLTREYQNLHIINRAPIRKA